MRQIYNRKSALALFTSMLIFLAYHIPYTIRFLEGLIPMDKCQVSYLEHLKMANGVDKSLNFWARSDVQTCTYWGAPIMWDGMFDPDVYDDEHMKRNTSVALTVFAVGRYIDAYLKDFLHSAEVFFMLSVPVTYYVFTDVPAKVPDMRVGPRRKLKVIHVKRHTRWQDISMMRMKAIAEAIESEIRHRHKYVFCMDVDQIFVGPFGTEALGDSVALLHAHFYHSPKIQLTYDHNPNSEAYMRDGDFYYHAAVFGGSWEKVKATTEACYRSIMKDKENNVEALWHDESHLNKHLFLHKPSKILSPEYCWDTGIGYRMDIHVPRLLWAEKHYKSLRAPVN
ncbi:alpha-1,3-galactosyltransferase 2-like [Denticeps clupeoides]|nr:alpha-1,3-galactosyltransferase 2 [Denticeps clupeoides]XP_028853681.1 alpha-1,3-galactosyltransferase 2 [Denticeps clupeoides]